MEVKNDLILFCLGLTNFLTNQLNDSTNHGNGEAKNSSVTQQTPHLLQNLKVHYHLRKFPLLLPVMSQTNPVHTSFPANFLKLFINFVIHDHITLFSFPTRVTCVFYSHDTETSPRETAIVRSSE